ncbi:MAG: hypothetical protein GX432_04945 [Candidatus Atribacteria bacterium]|nr:hypothetical protein [Candidatus Atribacteria bacterium]
MGIKAYGGEKEPVLVSEGVHIGVCIGVIDLGTQHSQVFDKDSHKVLVMWETPDETIDVDGTPMPLAISKIYTLSLHEKAQLRKDLESWRGKALTKEHLEKGIDLQELLGKACQLQVIHQINGERTFANITAVMALPKGTKGPQPVNKFKYFSFEDEGEIPDNIPNWIIEMIKESKEYKGG